MALALAAAQIDGARGGAPATLGWIYLTDHHADAADTLLAELRLRWPGTSWVGAGGVGICAGGAEYFDEPAVAVMLCDLPLTQFQVYSGTRRLEAFPAYSALVHADPATPELPELLADLSERTASGYLFGGLASGRTGVVTIADGVWRGGLSGVAFDGGVGLVSRVTQGCQPIGAERTVTAVERNVVTGLDDEPALACLLRDLQIDAQSAREALPRLRQTLVGLSDPEPTAGDAFRTPARRGAFGSDTRVRHLIGLDPGRGGIAIADEPERGMRLAFCQRNVEAARRDLVRICAEIREEIEPEIPLQTAAAPARRPAHHDLRDAAGGSGIAGAIYVSCAGRGGPHFGAPSAELAIVRHALGDVPLVGFFAAGEIARRHLYGYTGVLTVFRN
ncbi:MAG: FIST C-terminal domain-containing protein [Proteobacteria bacterium]|nr:FIST C-terminal domain-containing protein [Pseudomonadota bacterium]